MQTADIDYENVKSRVNISEVLGQYAAVPDFHRSVYRMSCPLHNGDGDNFKVDENEGKWYCYVCKQGGDVINLVAAFDHTNNSTAARKLAESNGLISKSDPFTRAWKRTFRQLQWMEKGLTPPPIDEGQIPATEDLYGFRNFSKESIDHFGLRLIPGHTWGCGIYIPVRTTDGTLVGYCIRQNDVLLAELVRSGKKPPKYLNTKGLGKEGLMYGLHENLASIKAAGFAYVVEGQFDCVAMWNKGYCNVVSSMGSTLSYQQAQQLMNVTSNLTVVYDGDEAGREGLQFIKSKFGSAFSISQIFLPEGDDPCSADLGAVL